VSTAADRAGNGHLVPGDDRSRMKDNFFDALIAIGAYQRWIPIKEDELVIRAEIQQRAQQVYEEEVRKLAGGLPFNIPNLP
jgi:hypothetical protein